MKTTAEKEWLLKQMKVSGGQKEERQVSGNEVHEVKTAGKVSKKARGFQDVAGMEELKQMVKDNFIDVLKNKDYAELYGITPPSLLFYGPSGCGKTFFAEKIAEEVGINFMKIVPDDLASTLVHGTQEKIGEVFRKAERKAPTLIFFDEFDAMVPQRTNDDHNCQNGEINEFLCMLNNAAEKGIYVMAATNHPERIDKAVLRTGRIDEMIYIDMPDAEARESLFRLALSKLPKEEGIDYLRLADLTQGYNCSDIAYIVKATSRMAFNTSIKDKSRPAASITQHQLEDVIARKAPSVSSKDLRGYERIRAEFSAKDKECKKYTVGFPV